MALIVLLVLPLLAGGVLVLSGLALPHGAPWQRPLAGAVALLTLVLAVWVSVSRPGVDHAWVPELGLRLSLGVDGISIPLVLLTAAVGVLVVALAAGSQLPGSGTVLGCLLLVVAGALATFTARDALLFYVAFEVVLVPMWVLISRHGDPHDPRARREAGLRFLLYTVVGSTLMLVGLLLLVTSAGTSDLASLVSAGAALPAGRQLTIALLLTLGLAVKVPVWPLHTWLPPAHTTAPTVGSVLLAAVLLKMGTYGLVRLPYAVVPRGFAALAPWLAIAGVVGILWGGLVCLVERDLKRLIAYSSVAHMGFVVLGICSGSDLGLQAALYGNLAHGVVSALLFVVVGGLKERWGSVDLARPWPALREIAPRRGFFLILGLAAALGLPGLAGFWGEFLAVVAAWRPAHLGELPVFRTVAVLAAVGGVLAAGYSLRVARLLWVGDAVTGSAQRPSGQVAPEKSTGGTVPGGESAKVGPGDVGTGEAGPGDAETRGVERAVLLALAVATVLLGLAPWLVLDLMAPAVRLLVGGAP